MNKIGICHHNSHQTAFLAVFVFCFLSGFSAFSQSIVVKGIVKDENTQVPIRDVNIIINGTNQGFITDHTGRFSLVLDKIPAAITLSCVGYETVYYDIAKISATPLAMIMRPRIYSLKEVEIPAKRFEYVFKDPDYSVLDYEIMDDNILLLIFRYQLKRSELILLTLSGDTISISPVPEMKPKNLFKDFLGNVHYVSTKGNAFQCFYNDRLKHFGFIYKISFDSLRMIALPFLFTSGDRCYFQEFTPDGFGARIGYYDKEHNKEYIRFLSGETTRDKYYGDLKFYSQWNENLGKTVSTIRGSENLRKPTFEADDLHAHRYFNYRKINAPLVKLGENNMAVFNFSEDVIELMDPKGKVYSSIPISFHKENDDNLLATVVNTIVPVSEWKWRGKILVDEYYRNAYTTFQKNGIVQIKKIDLKTGNLTTKFELPFPFPEKILIYKGVAYFLNKDEGQSVKWRLVKLNL